MRSKQTWITKLSPKTQAHVPAAISVIISWMEDDGSEFVSPSVNSSAAVTAYFSSIININGSTLDQLLGLYPVEEFEAQVMEDNTQTAQFYRASRIYRDVRLACPALNFTHEVSLQSTEPTYLFTVNSTRLQPVWNAENRSYFQIGHSSDVPYIFNEAILGADNSKSAFQLSAEVSSSFSEFATSGNPSTSKFNWSIAWRNKDADGPTIFVIGGPYGSGAVTLGPSGAAAARRGLSVNDRSMKLVENSTLANQRSMALAREKLVQRCAFIDSLSS